MGEPRRPIGAGSGENLAAPRPTASEAAGEVMTGSRLLRRLAACSISGYAIAAALIWGLALLDPDHLGHVLFHVGGAPVVALLWFFIGALFALAQLATSMTSIRLPRGPGSGTRIGCDWSRAGRPSLAGASRYVSQFHSRSVVEARRRKPHGRTDW